MPDSRYGPTVDQLAGMLEHAKDDAEWFLTAQRLYELHRRGWYLAHDAYSQGGNESGIHGTDISRPTESKALDDRVYRDRTGYEIESVIRHIQQAADHLAAAKLGGVHVLEKIPEELFGHVNSTDTCIACECSVSGTYNDRLRSGYCVRCYHRWRRAGMPDHGQFIARVRNNPDEQESA